MGAKALVIVAIVIMFSFQGAGRYVSDRIIERQIPTDPIGITEVVSSQGAKIRFKQPGKTGICETTPGVDDYSGYISLNEKTNMFFWFIEAREDLGNKPVSRKGRTYL